MTEKELFEYNIEFLKTAKDQFFAIYKEMIWWDCKELYELDLLATGIINRSLLLISWFNNLIENKNFLWAVSLIRLHLDSLLQLYAVFIVSDPHWFCNKKIKWKHTKDLKDRKWQKMTDWYLLKTFLADQNNKEFINLKDVYSETSWFIHFSDKHIFTSFSSINWNNFWILLSDKMENIPYEKQNEAFEIMIKITQWIFKYLIGWSYTKNTTYLKNEKH